MEMAQINPSIQELLLQWLCQVRYTFQHKGMEKDIWPSWGLRQGCIASPVLWAAFTALLSQAIDKRLEDTWSSDHSTMYADDTHLQWTFHSLQGFEQAIHELNRVIAVFRRLGMKVNINKTKAILRVTGHMKHHIRKHYIRSHGKERRLLLSPGDPSGWIQLVDQVEYLGLIISYDNFELQSVKHRINKAHNRRWSLASILHTKKVSISYKLNLWRSCVLSTMLYALHSLCLGAGQICLLQRALMRHIRAIVSDQAFLTGHTHEDIMIKYHIQTAQELLERAHEREQLNADSSDWIVDSDWNRSISKALLEAAQTKEPESDTEKAIWACPLCSEQFITQAALKIHARRAHKIVAQRKNIFNRLVHSVGGLPQCASCLKRFSKWQSLETHINTDACTVQTAWTQDPTADPSNPHETAASPTLQPAPEQISTPRKPTSTPTEVTAAPAGVQCSETMIAESVEGLQLQAVQPENIPELQNMAYGDPDWDEFFGELHGEDLPMTNAAPWTQPTTDNPFTFTGNKRRRNPFGEQQPVPHNMRRHPFQGPPPRTPVRDPLLYSLAKTVLQQQEELKVLKQDTALVLFLRPGEDNVLHHLYKVAAHFKAKQEQDATWQLGQNPLRMVLAIALFKEVTDRLNQTIASQEKLKRAVDQGWRDPQAGWRYQVWNHKTKQLQVDASRPPIPEDKLLDHFATILQCLRQPIVNRFRCTRRLTETMSSPATFKLDMSVRSHSALTMWDTLKMLQGNAVFQLAGMAYKTESLARGPVEQKIAEMVYGRR
ncbi:PKAR [Symbiodinium sp. CCMP2592]|nr:PKAR [Symbiodinium sp. CCMP2592]